MKGFMTNQKKVIRKNKRGNKRETHRNDHQ